MKSDFLHALLAFSLAAVACSGSAIPELARFAPPEDGGSPLDDGAPPVGHDAPAAESSRDGDGARDGSTETGPKPDAGVDAPALEAGSDVADAARTILCVRLYDPMRPNGITQLSEQVNKEYVTRVYRDCNVSKMARTDLDTIFEFYNDLLPFSLDLWGCTMHNAMGFGLVRANINITDLTSADAARLVEHYVAAATSVLRLDATEATQMRLDLTRLSALGITRQSDEFALSMCTADAGADGEGGAGGDAASTGVDGEGGTAEDAGPGESDAPEASDDAGGSG